MALKILRPRQWHEEITPSVDGTGTWLNRWVEPALAECICGLEIELDCDGARCECGRIYNLSGQELMPRQYWENDW